MTMRVGTRRALINPGTVAAAAPSGPPLDGISNIEVAYSVRRLLTSYTGSLLRLRRASDDAESDFGYDGSGNLDTAAIATFLAATTGYIKTWYDQSGNGKNVTNTTSSAQPLYTASGIGSKPELTFNGTSHILKTASSTIPVGFALAVASNSDNPTFSTFEGLLTGEAPVASTVLFVGSQGLATFDEGAGRVFPSGIYIGGVDTNVYLPAASGKIVTGRTSTPLNQSLIVIGQDRLVAGRFWSGGVSVAMVLSVEPTTADHNTIGASMAAYYGLSWTTVT